jgi:hypothetical protein
VIVEARVPLFADALEEPVGVVELAGLELYHPLRVLPHKETDHVSRTAVVRAKQVAVFLR